MELKYPDQYFGTIRGQIHGLFVLIKLVLFKKKRKVERYENLRAHDI